MGPCAAKGEHADCDKILVLSQLSTTVLSVRHGSVSKVEVIYQIRIIHDVMEIVSEKERDFSETMHEYR